MFDVKFDPRKNLRFFKRTFVKDGTVIKVVSMLQYNEIDGADWWHDIPVYEKTYNIKDENEIKTYYGVD